MNIRELETPAILVRKTAMEHNLQKYQSVCREHGKQLWPMVKTHKSTEICRLQQELGAVGFLCGTLDECEALCDAGFDTLMYAYPVAGEVSSRRVARLAKHCTFYVRLDGVEAAADLDRIAKEEQVMINYTIIIDCGLHRFGVEPGMAAKLAEQLKQFTNLRMAGISSHSGHVYGEADPDKISGYGKQEKEALHLAEKTLIDAGFPVEMVTTGSTPTFFDTVEDASIKVYHPGNYIFNDCIQIGNGTASEEECALVVYATVISHPREDLFLCDAGAKCLGLDQGAHGNASVKGFGRVIGYPELTVSGLSEEVGKLHVEVTEGKECSLKVGNRIMIIPNHACSSANLTDYFILVNEDETVEGYLKADMRGNKTRKCK